MFELKPIARHLLLACGSLAGVLMIAGPASAQQAQGQEQKLDRITITGSNIRRTDTETVAPVEIITREDIEKSGRATVAEVLRSIPSATGNSFNESFSNSFAAGASGISLRGLGQKATLVLINGRRVAGYGFAQNLQDTFVDLNSIPSSAVERIEVLKDGASAIYGSDAIAGVVNVILRRDFKGVEAGAAVGYSEGKTDYRANVAFGYGDVGSQKFNLFGVIDLYKREELLASETRFGKTRDFRSEQGGRNFQSATAGGTWTGVPGTANANERRAIAECAQYGGRVLDYAGLVAAGLVQTPAAAGTGQNLPGNTWCSTDIASHLSALPGAERIGFLGKGTFEFSPTVQGYAEVGYSHTKTEQTFTPPFFAGTTGLEPTPQGLRPYTYNINFAPGVAGNPLAANARFSGNLFALGDRDAEITSDAWRGLAGVKYAVFGWDLDSGLGYSKNEVEQFNINRLTLSGTSALFNVPTTPQPPTPVSNATTCNLNAPSTTLAACSSMLISFPRKATSELQFIDTKGSTEFGQLPGGPMGLALGAEFRSEKLNDRPDPNASGGNILGQGVTATDGSRRNTAVFAEMSLPLTNILEGSVALRNDKYSDFGNATTPKVGFKLKPSPEVVIRGNWGRGFRAPTLPEISPSSATFFVQVIDNLTNTIPQVSGVFAGNPNLQAEKSRSGTLGIVWEPNNNFNIGLTWYEINWNNIVTVDSFQSIVDGDSDSRAAGGPGDPRVLRDPITNTIITVFNNFRNASSQYINGVDLDSKFAARTTFGRLTTRFNASYVGRFELDGVNYAGENGFGSAIPRWKGTVSQDWEQGPALVRVALNYIDGYEQQFLPGSFFTPQNPSFQTGTYPVKVKSYTTIDLFGRYDITTKLSVSAAVNNVFDELPPYDPGFSTTSLYDFTQYDPRGRIYQLRVNYKFY